MQNPIKQSALILSAAAGLWAASPALAWYGHLRQWQ